MSLIDQRFGLARSKFVFDNEIGLTQIELKFGPRDGGFNARPVVWAKAPKRDDALQEPPGHNYSAVPGECHLLEISRTLVELHFVGDSCAI
jgi:hypothetical protein